MEIKDKIVVVTGAASGIGRALCLALPRMVPGKSSVPT